MKPINLYPQKIFTALLLFIALQSCIKSSRGTWKNEQIDAGKRPEFHVMNNQLLSGLKSGNMDSLGFLMSKDLINDGLTGRLVELVGGYVQNNSYQLLDEYYIVKWPTGGDTIKNTSHGINNYSLYFTDTTREMYIAFFIPKTGDNKYLISAYYNKFDFGWKLTGLHADQYTINGKTAPELFNLAKEEYGKGYLVNAVTIMDMAQKCVQPAEIWQYPAESDIGIFSAQAISEANDKYKFPLILTQVPTHPRIVRVVNETNDEGTFPKIYYLSSIDLKDTTALKVENENIKRIIGQVIPGIDKDKKCILFAASNKMPDATKEVDYFTRVDKLE